MVRKRTRVRRAGVLIAALMLLPIAATPARAQAWVPGKGEGAVAISFTDILIEKHRLPKVEVDRGHIRSKSLIFDFTYGLTDKVALDVGIPFVVAKYNGATPHPTGLVDYGAYHGTFQDVRLALRYNLMSGSVVSLTPFAGTIVPSHAYEFFAHSAAGRRLRELMVGTFLGLRLDPVVPGGFVQARYAYGFTEEVLDIPHNRSVIDVEVGYFVKPAVRVFALGNIQRTHGGLDLSLDSRTALGALYPYHDQITRDNHFNLGGGAAWSVNDSFDIFGSIGTNISGRNGHVIKRGITTGVAWSFGARRGADLIVRGPEAAPERRAQGRSLVRCVCQKGAP